MKPDTLTNTQEPTLNDQQFMRYSRQLMLPEIGDTGQLKLQQATVLIIGMGGLGTPAAQYLAGAGIGKLILVDFDEIELSNLPRQILYSENDIGESKVIAAQDRIQEVNSDIQVQVINQKLEEKALAQIIAQADLVLDCCDNLTTRYAINAQCRVLKVPHIAGAAIGFDGQFAFFDHKDTQAPCYRCLFPEGNEQQLNCSTAGVMGPVVGMMGAMQALASIEFLAGMPVASNQLRCFDGRSLSWQNWKINQDPHCPTCGNQDAN